MIQIEKLDRCLWYDYYYLKKFMHLDIFLPEENH